MKTYIDYFGGTHGNFLSLIIDLYVKQFPQPYNLNFFNSLGASHNKLDLFDYWRTQGVDLSHRTHTGHYSVEKRDIKDASVFRVRLHDSSKFIIAVTNSFVRTGDHYVDLNELHINTYSKLSAEKLLPIRDIFAEQYGKQHSYSISQLKPFFMSKFSDREHGVNLFNTFIDYDGCRFHNINFDKLFQLDTFFEEMNKCAYFLNENFYPTEVLVAQWDNFIKQNQGYHSWVNCNTAIDKIIRAESHEINLNVLEQSWINVELAKIYRVYDHPLLMGDTYPTNTLDIANAINDWKQRDKQCIL